jgi:hypothetical protein
MDTFNTKIMPTRRQAPQHIPIYHADIKTNKFGYAYPPLMFG